MKKIVIRFWIINLLISIILFVAYRIAISQTETINGNSFEKWIQFFELLLNFGFSFFYFIAMIIFSFAILLNLIKKVRNKLYLSFLTFLGLPSICIIYMIFTELINFQMLNFFSVIYIFIMTIQFLMFRKIIEKTRSE
ncbi:hypothetical protein EG359_02350 [Chryseobacterium joostei]|uniref:Uncharacterized protein n=1 Tax=Chryseobacterium joostei TaxID=112234 RepID=A0A1N7IM46_9FLAO|nr:hypothetical protein EG359_02350 [Chryseobacterium joostei]SIS38066.1 hypothetical protein SAMN05421768_10655 [Chryseobacterium joostei]